MILKSETFYIKQYKIYLMANIQKSSSTQLSTIGSQMLEHSSLKPYDTRISRDRPACVVFLIDQSGSMDNTWGIDNSKTKAEMVATYVNNAINEIINICQKSEPEPLHYFDIAVIGYGQNDDEAQIIWEGDLEGKAFVSPAELKANPTGNQGEIEVERKTFKGVSMVKIPVPFWFDATAQSLTPMGSAIDLCNNIVAKWVGSHKNSFPPIVINITDGDQTDCNNEILIEKAYLLKQNSTLYGNTLLFNIHISDDETDRPVAFPSHSAELPDNEQSKTLFAMSSNLPEIFNRRIAIEILKQDFSSQKTFVAMAYQASIEQFVKFLDIGTKTVKV